jgi:molybdenum cofactor guanylyltransferase
VTRPPLYGLVLAGGRSTRMQRDKAGLLYEGKPQLTRVVELAARHTDRAFVSVRADQADEPLRATHPVLVDTLEGEGPIVGIRSALAKHPHAAWLVLACDLPFLSDGVIEHLKLNRNPAAFATAYRSVHDNLPEPLCSIWEPSSAAALAAFVASGKDCPRKFLLRHEPVTLLEPKDSRALENINTPEEYAQASESLAGVS